ncbi:MAG: hypothetical protein GY863_21640, partial [bacterium]|nr:hypothetical protein [bacterium]
MKNIIIITMTAAFALLAVLSCGEPGPKDYAISPATGMAFVVTTDYNIGSYATIDMESLISYDDIGGDGIIHSDASARYFFGKIYIVNKQGRDNIQVLEPSLNYKTIMELSMGAGSNPHDIIAVSTDRAYVTRYNKGDIWIIDPSTGLKTGGIDISVYAHSTAAGKPRMSYLYYHEPTQRLFVEIQRLKGDWNPSEYSSVLVIDTDPANDNYNSVIADIKLQWGSESAINPYSRFRYVPKELWQPDTPDGNDHIFVSCVGLFGFFSTLDCGIVAIDIQDMHCEEGYILKEVTAGA